MSKITKSKHGNVGETRRVSFKDEEIEIKEVLDKPGFSLWWDWPAAPCPHCKRKIVRRIKHDFYRIEIMHDPNITSLTRTDLVVGGNTMDNRTMIIPDENDNYEKVLSKSKLFKHLI